MADSPTTPTRKRMKPVVGIFLTVFLDLLSFGLLIPDLQLRGRQLASEYLGHAASSSAVGLYTGITLAVFSLAQLITSPLLGRLSDRIGRRKILLVTTILSTMSYLVYAHASMLWIVILARILSGVAAANVGVAFAYIADVTKPEERAKSLGMIGAAFGLGFIFGPVAGGLLLKFGHNSPLVLGYVGAALAAINFLFVFFILPESLVAKREKSHFFSDFKTAFATPGLSLMLVMFFTIGFGFTNLETTFFQLLQDPNWIFHQGDGAKQTGSYILGIVGVVSVIMQGYVIRLASPKFGEVNILRFAYLGYVPILALVPFAPLWIPLILTVILMGICSGLAQPSLSSLISRSAPATIQGGIFGVTQALGALARFLGPLVSNPLFGWRPYAPYLLGAAVIMFPAAAAWKLKMPTSPGHANAIVVE